MTRSPRERRARLERSARLWWLLFFVTAGLALTALLVPMSEVHVLGAFIAGYAASAARTEARALARLRARWL